MNVSWEFKNVEEWKATSWWLLSWFDDLDKNEELRIQAIADHIRRSVRNQTDKNDESSVPYYCECLIHLVLLQKAGVISIDDNAKVSYNTSKENYEVLKELYNVEYIDLISYYLDKKDPSEFLAKFVVKIWQYYEAKDEELRTKLAKLYQNYLEFDNKIVG